MIQQERRHDLDWLRFIAILILLFFHTGMWFNTFGWHVKNSTTSTSFNYWMVWLHFWRMPLLLFISGAGTFMALGKRSPGQFAKERFSRLFIPLVFGMFVIVPPQIYFEHIKDYSNYWEFYKTVFEFKPYPEGSFSWHHLWFILYLFLFSIIALPLLIFLRSEKSANFKATLFTKLNRPVTLLLLPPSAIVLTQIVLRPFFPEETHDLVNDWAYFTFYFCFFLFGIIFYSQQKLWLTIGYARRYFLGAATIILVPFYGMFLQHMGNIPRVVNPEIGEIIFEVSATLLSYFTVMTVVAYGQQYLNRPHPWLSKINEGLYPFYILHQTVIIWIGFYICQLDWSIAGKFWAVSFLTLFSCVGFYMLMIRPFNFIRVLFGLKRIEKSGKIFEETMVARKVA